MSILVGPNNSGKSTVIDAFRLLSAGLRVAWYRTPERFRDHEGIERFGYRVPVQLLSVTTENAHTDYADEPAVVTFTMATGDELRIYFPPGEDSCLLLTIPTGAQVRSVSQFRSRYPSKIVTLPILGPLEHREVVVTQETLNRNLATRRASRSFRNFWYRDEGREFPTFRVRLAATWPGIDINPPEIAVSDEGTWLAMYCLEERLTRELYWSGFGFQVWCQLLTHMIRAEDAAVLALDEAELYLHPDLQRQLLGLLRELGPDIVLATHSSEITAEADPDEVVLIDKHRVRAKRVTAAEGVRAALTSLGSNRSLVLTQLARTKRGLLVEGEDFKIVRQFAKLVGFDRLATGLDFAVTPLGGFRDPRTIRSIGEGMELALGESLVFAVLLDRDYRSGEEYNAIQSALSWAHFGHVLQRKELENYLLIPDVLDRAISRAARDRAARMGETTSTAPVAMDLLDEVTNQMVDLARDAAVATQSDFLRSRDAALSMARAEAVALAEFQSRWSSIEGRIEIAPGKLVLSRLNALLQTRLNVSLSPSRIVASFTREDVPRELVRVIGGLDAFRNAAPLA
jgi:AAA domain, putative AbiEii toxin, Type IV TA system